MQTILKITNAADRVLVASILFKNGYTVKLTKVASKTYLEVKEEVEKC